MLFGLLNVQFGRTNFTLLTLLFTILPWTTPTTLFPPNDADAFFGSKLLIERHAISPAKARTEIAFSSEHPVRKLIETARRRSSRRSLLRTYPQSYRTRACANPYTDGNRSGSSAKFALVSLRFISSTFATTSFNVVPEKTPTISS